MSTSPRSSASSVPAHNVFHFDDVTFSSNFDNGNLGRVERVPHNPYSFKIWTAPDNFGTEYQSKHCAWFHFVVSGLPLGCVLRIQIVNASNHSGLYKHDMRPVYRSNATNQKWFRIKSAVRFSKENENATPQLFFEHGIEVADDKIYFAFTYPYTYNMVQNELTAICHENKFDEPHSMFYQRELLTLSRDGRRIDLLTITSIEGHTNEQEPLLSGLFPDSPTVNNRPPIWPNKEVVFISARVHSGEVPAQHTFKGILNLLLDKDDLRARELRSRYVFKLIPMLNPDGVYRGHFRMDQLGQNLNRYYCNPDALLQPAIYAAKTLMDYYAELGKLSVYMDFHAHASKRGCFIYGNVLDAVEDQIQNQLFCKLISMNSAHFDYEGCLFSKDHMFRTDPGDLAKGLTAEGSGRVWTYLSHGLIHSYTIECNYNTSRVGNEIAAPEVEPGGSNATAPSIFTANPEKYTPTTFAGVGRACLIAILDIKSHNPCSQITRSKCKTLDRVRNLVMMEVRNRKEYLGKPMNKDRRRHPGSSKVSGGSPLPLEEFPWRRVVEPETIPTAGGPSPLNLPATGAAGGTVLTSVSARVTPVSASSASSSTAAGNGQIMFIPARDKLKRRNTGGVMLQSAVVDQYEPSTQPASNSLTPTPPTASQEGGVLVNPKSTKLASYFSRNKGQPGSAVAASGSTSAAACNGIAGMSDELVVQNSMSRNTSREFRSISDQHYQLDTGHNNNDEETLGHIHSNVLNPKVRSRMEGRALSAGAAGQSNNSNSASLLTGGEIVGVGAGIGGAVPKKSLIPTHHKDNRKLLSKALNPAGVALLMSGIAATTSPAPPQPPSTVVGTERNSTSQLPDVNAYRTRDQLVVVSQQASSKELVREHLPSIAKSHTTEDLPHLASMDNNVSLSKLVEATLGGSAKMMASPSKRKVLITSDIPAGPVGEGSLENDKELNSPRRGTYSIKAALMSDFPIEGGQLSPRN